MFPHRVPRHDEPTWSETRWFGSWNETDRVGLFVHLGRFLPAKDLWWIQAVAYLPDGTLAVDRSWGSESDRWNLASGVFSLRGRGDGSVVSLFSGAPERLTTAELATHPGGSGASVPMTWELELEPLREPWTPFEHEDSSAEWADAHVQLQYTARGSLTVGGETWSLDGPAFGDHSSGSRTWDGFGSHLFVNVPFEHDGLVLIAVRTPEDRPAMTVGAVLGKDGTVDRIVESSAPWLSSLLGVPHTFELGVVTESGRTVTWQVEVEHTLPATITESNDNSNGLDWRADGNPLLLAECIARFTAADGTSVHGHLERSAKRSRVDPQTLEVQTLEVRDV